MAPAIYRVGGVFEDADTTEATQALHKFSLQMTRSAMLSSRAWLQPRDPVLDAVESGGSSEQPTILFDCTISRAKGYRCA